MTEPMTFAVVGTGWRSEFYLRLARTAPERLRAVAIVANSSAAEERMSARWDAPVVRTLEEALAHGPTS